MVTWSIYQCCYCYSRPPLTFILGTVYMFFKPHIDCYLMPHVLMFTDDRCCQRIGGVFL